jgi:hypothetical protein
MGIGLEGELNGVEASWLPPGEGGQEDEAE